MINMVYKDPRIDNPECWECPTKKMKREKNSIQGRQSKVGKAALSRIKRKNEIKRED